MTFRDDNPASESSRIDDVDVKSVMARVEDFDTNTAPMLYQLGASPRNAAASSGRRMPILDEAVVAEVRMSTPVTTRSVGTTEVCPSEISGIPRISSIARVVLVIAPPTPGV
jgi:hypothetical protein